MKKTFTTSDFALIATLVYKGFAPALSPESGSQRVNFTFEVKGDLPEIIEDYNAKQLLVEPNEFFMCIKNIKSRIYDLKRYL